MSKDIFDTNIYIKYDVIPDEKLLFSAVVLQEMTVGAGDSNELKEWEALRKRFREKKFTNHSKRRRLVFGRQSIKFSASRFEICKQRQNAQTFAR